MMMKETIDLLGKILTNILTALYEPFGFSLLLSFLVMFFYLYAYEPAAAGRGWKNAIVTWYQKFRESVFSGSDVDIRRKDWKELEEKPMAEREDSILLFDKH